MKSIEQISKVASLEEAMQKQNAIIEQLTKTVQLLSEQKAKSVSKKAVPEYDGLKRDEAKKLQRSINKHMKKHKGIATVEFVKVVRASKEKPAKVILKGYDKVDKSFDVATDRAILMKTYKTGESSEVAFHL